MARSFQSGRSLSPQIVSAAAALEAGLERRILGGRGGTRLALTL